ncbi:MAG: lipoprotein insertase outer membrane protein LolB [Gammaproteobacteria bacterium]
MSEVIRPSLTGLLLMLLAACTSTPVIDTGGPLRPVSEIRQWELSGRVSITRGDEGWHAGLLWHQQDGRYRLQVSGPLGQGAFELSGNDAGVVLRDADGQRYAARDAESLLLQVTGWRLPVDGLRFWVRGLPAPGGDPQETRDAAGRLVQLAQAGWDIRYDRYRLQDGYAWPGRLKLVRDDIAVRLVIDSWRPELPAGDGA